MTNKDHLDIIPAQESGEEIEVESSLSCNTENEAMQLFRMAKAQLLDVNNWHKVAGLVSAVFQIISKEKVEVEREVQKGDYLRIDIPGPGSSEGDGYDWVCVEELRKVDEGEIQSVGFRVSPCANPFSENTEVAHFYANSATSNFIVTREGLKLSAWIIDRNLKPNTDSKSLTDKIRNTGAGMGAIGIFSKTQWQGLADGLIKSTGKQPEKEA